MKRFTIFLIIISVVSAITNAQPTQPPTPLSCNASNCTPAVSETCTGTSTIVASFTGATLRSGSPTSLPAVYSFYNIAAISGQSINATVTIESQSNCSMSGTNFNIDDDAATDQSGNSIATFFAPRITPDQNLTTTDRRGYVQFTIRFYIENSSAGEQYPGDYTTVPSGGGLSGLNYIHYDIDGSSQGTGGWFRETGLIQDVTGSLVNGDVSTELVAYNYTDGFNWKGFAGSVCERTGVSRCAQVAAAASYSTPQTSITFRMGYDYNYTNSNFNSQPTRQYGSRFGCFSFPQQTPLPVRLLNFSGIYRNQSVLLNWTADNEVNFSAYEVERSSNGISFESIAVKHKQGSGTNKEQYSYTDELSTTTDRIFYYRLKMLDIDGKYSYSGVIMIKIDEENIGLMVSPNPVKTGYAVTIRYRSDRRGIADIKMMDASGKTVLRQQFNVSQGVNSLLLNNTHTLLPGLYVLQVNDGQRSQAAKLYVSQ